MISSLRRPLGALVCLLLAAAVLLGTAGSASSVDGYRYWNYFHLQTGSWEFSQVGPAEFQPEDGAVEGYRFGTSTTAEGIPPRADLAEVNFDSICGGTQAGNGEKLVAVVLDYGTEADADGETPPAPRAECAAVDQGATGQQVLNSVADVRVESGLTCAINGYPAEGCGEPVPDASPPPDEQPVAFELPASPEEGESADGAGSAADGSEDSSLALPLILAGVLVVALAVGAFLLSRRNRSA